MLTPKDFTVGQRLLFVETEHRRGRESNTEWHVVKAVGRKYVTTGREDSPVVSHMDRKFAPPNLHSEGWPRGRLYLSLEAYELERAMESEWSKMRAFMRDTYRMPASLTLEDMKAINAKLGAGS